MLVPRNSNSRSSLRVISLTELHGEPAEPEARQHHLAQTECGTEAGEEADGQDAEEVEEQADEDGIDEAQVEERFAENANGEGTHDHVGRQPLEEDSSQSHSSQDLGLPRGIQKYIPCKLAIDQHTMLPILT